MPVTTLGAVRYPVSGDVPNIAQYFQNLAEDVAKQLVPRFTSAANRDTAYSAFTTAGGTLEDGMECTVAGVPLLRRGGQWREIGVRTITRLHTPVSSSIPSGAFRESGVADGPVIAGFTLTGAARVSVFAQFRCGVASANVGAAIPSVKLDGTTVSDSVQRITDNGITLIGAADLLAGARTVSVRVDASGGACTWVNTSLVLSIGIPE